MDLQRPDLSHVPNEVRNYIRALEAEIERLEQRSSRAKSGPAPAPAPEAAEPPTTIHVITATSTGVAKRTPRHLYQRQHRGGMGIFDMETPEDQAVAILQLADVQDTLLMITHTAKSYRLPVKSIQAKGVREKGEPILPILKNDPGEHIAVMLPIRAQGFLTILSQTGMVRKLRHHVFGEYMKPGSSLYDPTSYGAVASACWIAGDEDLLIATRSGRAIRFASKAIPPQGCLGIRLSGGDQAIAITPVYPDSRIFMLAGDGKGTIRLMDNFNPNKNPGAGGKLAMKTGHLVSALNVDETDDIFVISEFSKIIRFRKDEVPETDGVVQGVHCMSLRGDRVVCAATNQMTGLV